jgi:hypothetical protein
MSITLAQTAKTFSRLFDAMMVSRRRRANHEIARYLAARHQFSISSDCSPDHQMMTTQT